MKNKIHKGLIKNEVTHPRIYKMRFIERKLISNLINSIEIITDENFEHEFPPILETDQMIYYSKRTDDEYRKLIDPWGIYRPLTGDIVIFKKNIEKTLQKINGEQLTEEEEKYLDDMGIDITMLKKMRTNNNILEYKDFRSVVLFHEFGHWLFHRYPINNSTAWPVPEWKPFSNDRVPSLSEGFAQLIACIIASKDAKLSKIFNKKVSLQKNEYLAHGEILKIVDIGWDESTKEACFKEITDDKIKLLIDSFIYLRNNEIKDYFIWKLILCFKNNKIDKLTDNLNLQIKQGHVNNICTLKNIIKETENEGHHRIIKEFILFLIDNWSDFDKSEELINDIIKVSKIKYFKNIKKDMEWFDTNGKGYKILKDNNEGKFSQSDCKYIEYDDIKNVEKIIATDIDIILNDNSKNIRGYFYNTISRIIRDDSKNYLIIKYYIEYTKNKEGLKIILNILKESYKDEIFHIIDNNIDDILKMYDKKEEFINDEMFKLIQNLISNNSNNSNVYKIKKSIKEKFNLTDSDIEPEPEEKLVLREEIKIGAKFKLW